MSFVRDKVANTIRLKEIPINGTITKIGSTKAPVRYVTQLEIFSIYETKSNLEKVSVYDHNHAY